MESEELRQRLSNIEKRISWLQQEYLKAQLEKQPNTKIIKKIKTPVDEVKEK